MAGPIGASLFQTLHDIRCSAPAIWTSPRERSLGERRRCRTARADTAGEPVSSEGPRVSLRATPETQRCTQRVSPVRMSDLAISVWTIRVWKSVEAATRSDGAGRSEPVGSGHVPSEHEGTVINSGMRIALGVAVGHFLGRTRKMKVALMRAGTGLEPEDLNIDLGPLGPLMADDRHTDTPQRSEVGATRVWKRDRTGILRPTLPTR